MKNLFFVLVLVLPLSSLANTSQYTSEELCRIQAYVPLLGKLRDTAQAKTANYIDEKWQKIMEDAPSSANELRMKEFENARYNLWDGFCGGSEDLMVDVLAESAQDYKKCLEAHEQYSGSLYTSMEKVKAMREQLSSSRFRGFNRNNVCVGEFLDKTGKDPSFFKGGPVEVCKKSVKLWNQTFKSCGSLSLEN